MSLRSAKSRMSLQNFNAYVDVCAPYLPIAQRLIGHQTHEGLILAPIWDLPRMDPTCQVLISHMPHGVKQHPQLCQVEQQPHCWLQGELESLTQQAQQLQLWAPGV